METINGDKTEARLNKAELKDLCRRLHPRFWPLLKQRTDEATEFDDLIFLSTLRKRAIADGLAKQNLADVRSLRMAILGGCSLYPLSELLAHLLDTAGFACQFFSGDYDNFVAEIMEPGGAIYEFRPDVTLLLPGVQRCKYSGLLTDPREMVESFASDTAKQLLSLCNTLHDRTSSEIILGNFMLPARRDLGEFRTRTLASDWSFRKCVNLELGLNAPHFVRICDLEFLANRRGALQSEDPRGWFESKQLCSTDLLVDVSREVTQLVTARYLPPKKLLALDLDNTLWGGVVAEDGIEGIEIGDTSPRGEAFKTFQKYIVSLKERGVLLAICSKNDHAVALEPFEKHPEMQLRVADFASIKANWQPKSDNLRQIAKDLNLHLDSFVFVDDNPAEIEVVRQFAPEVTAILLTKDPADYVGQLQDCGLFEPRSITVEDAQRTVQYRSENERQTLLASATDMNAYLESLEMKAAISAFTKLDVPRLAQLINKSNQFNLTTRRRTEAEVDALIGVPDHLCLSVRLRDRFGDHGLVSIVIGRCSGDELTIDTWLMSCRVLKRQVEETLLNELARRSKAMGCSRIKGIYIKTEKNDMVRTFFSTMGFDPVDVTDARGEYTLELATFHPRPTTIAVQEGS